MIQLNSFTKVLWALCVAGILTRHVYQPGTAVGQETHHAKFMYTQKQPQDAAGQESHHTKFMYTQKQPQDAAGQEPHRAEVIVRNLCKTACEIRKVNHVELSSISLGGRVHFSEGPVQLVCVFKPISPSVFVRQVSVPNDANIGNTDPAQSGYGVNAASFRAAVAPIP